jgi:hypothetical protein
MNALVATFTELLTSLNQSLRLSASFPALLLVAANVGLMERYLKASLFDPLFSDSPSVGIVACSALTLIIAFALSSLNVPIVKCLEGYSIRRRWIGRWLTGAHVERLQWLHQEEDRLNGRIQERRDLLKQDPSNRDASRELIRAAIDLGDVVTEMQSYFPTKEHLVMPTRLGNAIAAFEDYPNWRYGIDAVSLWPRLVPTLKRVEYSSVVERYKTAFDFFINMTLISIFFAIELAYVIAYFEGRLPVIEFPPLVLLVWIFYRFTTAVAINWGKTVKVAFDLCRHELRTVLHLCRPNNYSEEVELWTRYSAFLQNPEAKMYEGDLVYEEEPADR